MSALLEILGASCLCRASICPPTKFKEAEVRVCSGSSMESEGNQATSDQSLLLRLKIHSKALVPKIKQRRATLKRLILRSTRTYDTISEVGSTLAKLEFEREMGVEPSVSSGSFVIINSTAFSSPACHLSPFLSTFLLKSTTAFLLKTANVLAESAFFPAATTYFRSTSFASNFRVATSLSKDVNISNPELQARNFMCSDAMAG
jgi:hypothetical protein